MFNLYAIFPFFLLLSLAYYLNSKKLKDTKFQIFILSLIETTFGYLLLLMFFLQSFFPNIGYFMLNLLFFIIIAIVLYFFIKDDYEDTDLQIETIKNIIVIFLLTILPLYVFLTIFRFMPFYFQIILSLLSTLLLLYLSFNHKIYERSFFKKILFKLSFVDPAGKFIIVFAMIAITAISVVLFQLPSNKVGEFLNLSNNIPFYSFDNFTTDINNNFIKDEVFKFDTENQFEIGEKITDYYYDDQYLYYYTSFNRLFVFDLITEQQVLVERLDSPGFIIDENKLSASFANYNRFTYFDNKIILFGLYHTYIVKNDTVTNISTVGDYFAEYYYEDNELFFLNEEIPDLFEIFKFDNGTITLVETIDLSTKNYEDLIVIYDTLFYYNVNEYTLFYDVSISFEIEDGNAIYDDVSQTMYYTKAGNDTTQYIKVSFDGLSSNMFLNNLHNHLGIISGEYIYFVNEDTGELGNIEILNKDINVDSIFNHTESEKFFVGNKYYSNYISNYNDNDGILEFFQVDRSSDFITIGVYQLNHKEVDIDFPFYAHYGVWIFIPIIIAFFVPITNYRKTIVVLDQSKSFYDKQL